MRSKDFCNTPMQEYSAVQYSTHPRPEAHPNVSFDHQPQKEGCELPYVPVQYGTICRFVRGIQATPLFSSRAFFWELWYPPPPIRALAEHSGNAPKRKTEKEPKHIKERSRSTHQTSRRPYLYSTVKSTMASKPSRCLQRHRLCAHRLGRAQESRPSLWPLAPTRPVITLSTAIRTLLSCACRVREWCRRICERWCRRHID